MSEALSFPGTHRFEVQGYLGQGAMGAVYRVRDCELGREVALKTMHRLGPGEAQQLRREFRARAGITHQNLLQLYELFVGDAQCFFTMELVEGDDFLRWTRERLGIAAASSTPRAPPAPAGAALLGSTLGVTGSVKLTSDAAEGGALGGHEPTAAPLVEVGSHEPPTEEAWARLRRGLAQLIQGLRALHEAGRVHRDVKPRNVLVAPGDRVVLLDFGLLAEVDGPGNVGRWARMRAGTPAYMAPEQVLGQPLTAAADLYAVGVMLFEALAGALPYEGDASRILGLKIRCEPPSLRALAPDAPADLVDLAMDLLALDPDRRPDAEGCLARLGQARERAGRPQPPASAGAVRPPFVGRACEIDALSAAFTEVVDRRAQVTLHIHGPSGIGKSTLVRRFLAAERRAGEILVLAGRCHPQESVPYKALDAAIDELAQHLEALPEASVAALLPARAYALVHLFPVLAKLPAMRDAPAPAVLPDAVDLRQQGFGALRELFAALAAARPMIVWLDDVQWGDLDSAPLLDELTRAGKAGAPGDHGAPPFLLLLTYRSDDRERSPLLRHLLRERDTGGGATHAAREIALGALAKDDVAELARAFIDAGDERARAAQIEAVIAQSEGNPFMACEMARYVAAHAAGGLERPGQARMDVAHLVMERVRALDPARRRLLEVAAVAGKPLDRSVALAAAGWGESERPMVAWLRDANLLREVAGEEKSLIAPYHDRIREVLLEAMAPDDRGQRHRGIAEALTAQGSGDFEALLHHWEGAGERRRAGEYAVRAADRAAAARAFDHAARLYEKSLELGAGGEALRASLLEKLGDALANRGRAPEAARRYLEAARASGGDTGALHTRAAEQYIKGGFIDEGWREMRGVLEGLRVPIPTSSLGAVGAASWRRMLFLLRRVDARRRTFPDALPARERPLLTALWTASTSIVMVNPHLADAFRMIHLRRALAIGDTSTVCRALAYEAAMETHIGGALLDRSVEHLLAQVADLAARTGDPYDAAWHELAVANVAFTHAQWRRTAEACRRADAIFREQCPGSAWERVTVAIFHHCALAMLGELRELLARLEELAEDARLRGDIHARCEAFVGEPMLAWLAADRGDEARAQARAALGRQAPRSRSWPESGYRRQQYADMLASTYAAHYRGDPWPAWTEVLENWPGLRSSLLLPLRCTGLELRWARARAALAAAATPGPAGTRWTRSALLDDARRQIGGIKRDPLELGGPVASILRAGIARIEGREREAARLLEEAVAGFDRLDMALHREAARMALAELIGGDRGEALRRGAEAWMAEQGVARPRALAAAVAPGLLRRERRGSGEAAR